MGLKGSGYYSLRDILGYNCKYNIVLSDRGRGKSWEAKWFLMNQDGKFMCLYRQQPDMAAAMMDWTDPLTQGDDEHDPIPPTSFEWKGSDKDGWTLWFEGRPKGYFRYLTQVNHIKQEVFPDDLNWVWLDEFIPLVYRKLPGVSSEGDAIRTIVKTIEHDSVRTREQKGLKPLRVLMFANPFTWNNPILSYFKVVPKGYGIWKVGPGIACELLPPMEMDTDGKMTVDQFLGDEVNRNQGWVDQKAYVVERWPKGLIPFMSIRIGDRFFIVHRKDGAKKYYVKEVSEHNRNCQYVMGSLDGMREYESCLTGTKILQHLQTKAYIGGIWFADINCKFDFLNAIVRPLPETIYPLRRDPVLQWK